MTQAKNYKLTHNINVNVLKAYDIRGTVGKDLFTEDAYFVGKSVATVLYRKYGSGNKFMIGSV